MSNARAVPWMEVGLAPSSIYLDVGAGATEAPGDVTYAELALDFELTVQGAPHAQPKHALRLVVLPR